MSARVFVVCESVAAITTHLRELTPDTPPVSLSGFTKRPQTLCGGEAAWDTKLPLGSTRCMRCREKYTATMGHARWSAS